MQHGDPARRAPDALTLLRALRTDRPVPDPAVRAVSNRLAATLGIPLDSLASTPAGGAEAIHVSSQPPACVGVVETAALRPGSLTTPLIRPWIWNAVCAVMGLLVGAGVYRAVEPEKVRFVYLTPSAPKTSAPPIRSSAPQETAGIESTPREENVDPIPAREADAEPGAGSARRHSVGQADWTRERSLLDQARRSLASRNPADCLRQLREHTSKYPSGRLAEEREAMLINALVSTGDYARARQKAEAFQRSYPRSFLMASVEAAIKAIP